MREGWRCDAIREAYALALALWWAVLLLLLWILFLMFLMLLLLFLATHRNQPQRQLLCPGVKRGWVSQSSQSADGRQRVTALGCKARQTLVSRRVRLWDWVRCTAFNLQAVLYSLLLVLLLFLLLLLCLCLCGCLALPSWTLLALASSHYT